MFVCRRKKINRKKVEKCSPSGLRLVLVCSVESICFSSAAISLDLVIVILADLWLFNSIDSSEFQLLFFFLGSFLQLAVDVTCFSLCPLVKWYNRCDRISNQEEFFVEMFSLYWLDINTDVSRSLQTTKRMSVVWFCWFIEYCWMCQFVIGHIVRSFS